MSRARWTVFVSAAEASGDQHAAHLIRAIRRRAPDVRVVGVGGPEMAAAGCEILLDPTQRASMTSGPLFDLWYWRRVVREAQAAIRDLRPQLHVPVDSPALNWHLAASAKSMGAKVFYYIAPQVWAWAPWRVKKVARLTDHVGCILPFEQRYLRHRGVEATYVGHPLFDALPPRPDPLPDLLDAYARGAWRMAVLPGSRPGEIRAHAPAFLDAARAVQRRWKKSRVTVAAPSERAAAAVREACGEPDLDVAAGRTGEVLADSHFALSVSGTVTLEVAWFGLPMINVYKVGPLRYHLVGRWLIQTPHLSLPNILAGRRLVPELMPWHGRRGAVREAVLDVLDDLGWIVETRQALLELTDRLRLPEGRTASDNAARLALRTAGR